MGPPRPKYNTELPASALLQLSSLKTHSSFGASSVFYFFCIFTSQIPQPSSAWPIAFWNTPFNKSDFFRISLTLIVCYLSKEELRTNANCTSVSLSATPSPPHHVAGWHQSSHRPQMVTWGQGAYRNSAVSPQFCCKPKTVLKKSSLFFAIGFKEGQRSSPAKRA